MVMIIHKCILRDINKCLIKQRGKGRGRKGEHCVKEIPPRFLKSLKTSTHSESLNRECAMFPNILNA